MCPALPGGRSGLLDLVPLNTDKGRIDRQGNCHAGSTHALQGTGLHCKAHHIPCPNVILVIREPSHLPRTANYRVPHSVLEGKNHRLESRFKYKVAPSLLVTFLVEDPDQNSARSGIEN